MRECRHEDVVEVAQDGGERLGLLGRRRRQPLPQLPGLDLCQHRQVAHPLEIVGHPADRGGAVLAKARQELFLSFSISGQGRVLRI